ncbi:MAG: non-homologous end-joining DNA ligase [Syntrophomonas sp.]|uniref:non-homologous end-joining DNA ligase n=1 Tax=Syntrophomonas sp. TaxID=2053627 RepID=UPI002626137C|nr:non-homologous end-joining DNA ligase [Syntrophomonas sp.]MDD4627566.1 non-homologous end-joining DNA ligase [Syntrophomonas sp.]
MIINMGESATIAMAGREIKLTNLDRVLWPEDGYCKRDLVEYYAAVFPYMLPHLSERPLVFTRYPRGIGEKSFYQKNAPEGLPQWIKTFTWAGSDGDSKNYVLIQQTADLMWLANLACIEIHPWLSQINSIEYPDFIVFDLDPSEQSTFEQIISVARLLQELMNSLGLRVYPKTSGAKGLHLYLPIAKDYTYSQIRRVAQAMAEMVCQVIPDIATTERSLKNRGSRVYLDYLQNGLGKTVCAAYSVRPHKGAPCSTPIEWQELESIRPDQFTIKTLPERLQQVGDLFADVLNDRQDLKKAMATLGVY